jgi:Predicted integral membrane protein (DUF2269)
MSWFELLLTIHILAVALWFGSGLAITVISYRLIGTRDAALGPFVTGAAWWAGRAHPAASVVILLAGLGMVGDSEFVSFGDLWIILGLVGWVIVGALGGRFIGPTAEQLAETATAGGVTEAVKPLADRLLLFTRIEAGLLALLIAIMVAKPD